MPKFYEYRQNNSFGRFEGPVHIIVEANSAAEANLLAVSKAGIYFDGCYDGIDCDCCGDRWDRTDDYDASPVPSVYGEPVGPNNYPDAVIYYLDGTTKVAKDLTP